MELKMWQVDAFAEKAFEGNPAAVIPLEAEIPESLMQAIAAENNLSETAFLLPVPGAAPGRFHLRWFTPECEVPLCGHATLASAWVVFNHLCVDQKHVHFMTESGELTVTRETDGVLAMSLPAYPALPHPDAEDFTEALEEALDIGPEEVFRANYAIALFGSPEEIQEIECDSVLSDTLQEFNEDGLIVTAPGGDTGYDFVSRFFAPGKGVLEDPVTGSAHAALVPFWSRRLGKTKLKARQLSQRGGTLMCEDLGERVLIRGRVAPYLEGRITLPASAQR